MLKTCQDNFTTTFQTYDQMWDYHNQLENESQWQRFKVCDLKIEPLDTASVLYSNPAAFSSGVTEDAVIDTANNLGLAIRANGILYPIRDTAYKSLLDRAKINGTALPKLSRKQLSDVLNACLSLYSSEALLLIRNEKVAAVHSGDSSDYSVLPIDELLTVLKQKLDKHFPGNKFVFGYSDHSVSTATWQMPNQKEELLGTYSKTLDSIGGAALSNRLIPGVRFITSDTGVGSAKVSALLMGMQYPIHIGSCIAVNHRHQTKIQKFEDVLDQLFAQFGDSVAKLQKLVEIPVDYPINTMTRICKELRLPKKASMEAVSMYEMAYGGGPATAHDVFMALQEIPFILRSEKAPESKLLALEENMARILSLKWSDYDLAKAVRY